jgi:hypothetical protein
MRRLSIFSVYPLYNWHDEFWMTYVVNFILACPPLVETHDLPPEADARTLSARAMATTALYPDYIDRFKKL